MRSTAMLVVFSASLVGCKLNFGSTLKDESAAEGPMTTVHGMPVPQSTYDSVLLALGNSPATSSDTMIASDGAGSDSSATNDLDTSAFALQGGDTAYMEKCRKLGVPIPPPWGDAKWKPLVTLASSRIFALDPRLKTTLYTYDDGKGGVCAALPRLNGAEIAALGMICQSPGANACFWDNVERQVSMDAKGRRFQAKINVPSRIRPEIMADGDSLVENCSGCHRGDNVFIIHEDTDMTRIPNSGTSQTYKPVSAQAGWGNPEAANVVAPTCYNGDCHKVQPTLTAEYCSTVLMPSLKSKRWEFDERLKQWVQKDIHKGKGAPMPPKEVDADDYKNDISALETACRKFVPADRWVWID